MKKITLLLILQCILSLSISQNIQIEGIVLENNNKEDVPIIGANIYTEDKKFGTISNLEGYFSIELPIGQYDSLYVTYIGFQEKGISLNKQKHKVYLEADVLEEITINFEKPDRSTIDPYNSQTLDNKELLKAACCNLSESFETNAAVDVHFADAVTGAKRIKMLGLDGFYTQIMYENQPSIRGLANSFGLLYVPGPFMHSISINKGAGSVVNGYDALTGQINYNYKQPYDSERFYLNLFGTRHGQFELNTAVSHRFNEKLSTNLMVHGMIHEVKHDNNDDSFQDVPLNERIVVSNKWTYYSNKNFETQFGVNYTFDDRRAGQLESLAINSGKENLFQTQIVNRRYDAYVKTGFIFNNQLQNIGVQYRYINHQQQAWFGNRFYNGLENFANVNFIFHTKMNNDHNEMKLGASYVFNDFDVSLDDLDLGRRESVPGVFAEFTHQDEEKMAIVAGIRADMHNTHGFWLSPKFNFKYNFPKKFTLKLAAGKAYRTPNIIAENLQGLASNRVIAVEQNLGFECAWNYGGSLMKDFYLGFQKAGIVVDYYRTDFTNRLIADYETPSVLNFYYLDGKSYANSFQIETRVNAAEGLDIQLAYKFDDVHINYQSGLKLAPYIPRHKLLLTTDYETPNEKWRFNLTGQLNGKSRIPTTASNPIEYQRPDESKIFFNLNAQITTKVKRVEFYLGGENLFNVWQNNPIIASDDTFGSFFDASMIWGPLGGTRLYGGIRLTIPYKNKKEKN